MQASKPLISIVMTMADHRGWAMDAVKSWAASQQCHGDLFEIILILDATVRMLEPRLRPMLRHHDKLLIAETTDEIKQYDAGARQANGEFLFFTEPHCMALPDTVTEIIRQIQASNADGFCAHTIAVCRNRLAQMESRMFESGFAIWSQPGDWRKVILRGFAIRRQVYLAAGGFTTRYGRFAEWLLAADLHRQGYRLDYAPRVAVRHCYTDNLPLLASFIREFTDCECLYRLEQPSAWCENFFGSPPEWQAVLASDRATARQVLRCVRRQQIAPSGWRARWRQQLSLCANICFGPYRYWFASQLAVWLAKLRCHLWRFDEQRMYRAFVDYYMHTTALCRIRFALRHRQLSIESSGPQSTYQIASLSPSQTFGFHSLEHHQGHSFRWSAVASALKLHLAPATYRCTMRLLPVRSLEPKRDIALFMNETALAEVTWDAVSHSLEFTVPQQSLSIAGPQTLVICCVPLKIDSKQSSERRQLGIPVVSVHFTAQSERTNDVC